MLHVAAAAVHARTAWDGFTGVFNDVSTTSSSPSSFIPDALQSQYDAALLRELDGEGRCVRLQFDEFILYNCYFPHASSENAQRSEYKLLYYQLFQQRVEQDLQHGHRVLIIGDINACHRVQDYYEEHAMTKQQMCATLHTTICLCACMPLAHSALTCVPDCARCLCMAVRSSRTIHRANGCMSSS